MPVDDTWCSHPKLGSTAFSQGDAEAHRGWTCDRLKEICDLLRVIE